MRARRVLILVFMALLAGCTPRLTVRPAQTPALNLAGPVPDVVLLSVSGRCGVPCEAPHDNWDYLTSRGTVDRVAQVLSAQGLRVQVAGYASHPQARFSSALVPAPQRGFAALQADLNTLAATWLRGARPPRLVLLGHSQGSAWLHHLARVNPQVTFDVQIDLDGICLAWATDFGRLARDLNLPVSLLEACDTFRVVGRSVSGKDVVWPNVRVNLEVQSQRLPTLDAQGFPVNYLFELAPNVRLDGGRSGIERFVSAREDHSAVTRPGSEALAWVTARLSALASEWEPAAP
ncbi:hypothetical protein [Deinococcus arcticus]|uniref:Alpha/beta hydrolase n=1 Tax=Deinococcus arcticus TaxID=2136176 RepID=A0A2T3WCD6_9DEIO|nr:hypothetical protein [Deinococcus arcticus]PTA69575.1 hypothetical protein C8263_00660 [Deinococcus arcticus]